MLFNSFHFLAFLPIILVAHYLTPQRYRWALLLGASYYFYMSWNPWYLLLILASTLVDYSAALRIYKTDKPSLRKKWLYASILTNLGILFSFKYFNFFIDSFDQMMTAVGISVPTLYLNVILPVGISFYTFQTISYTVDVYKGKLKPEQHLGRFALFVSFFPQLVAGPIERAGRLLPQFRNRPTINLEDIKAGINRILYGFFKKVVIADRLAYYVDQVYSDIPGSPGLVIFIASFFFLIQVYCDFSGYSDIAVGIARLLGYNLTINFSRPFLATSFAEYWQRWHISLSNWVRDYIYIPLGGNRVSATRLHVNIIISFVIMGLWHGASWTFVLWGFMHGGLLILERVIGQHIGRVLPKVATRLLGWFTVMLSFVLSMIFFRAENLHDAFMAFESLFNMSPNISLRQVMAGLDPNDFYMSLVVIFLLALSYLLPQNFNFRYNYAFATVTLLLILLLGVHENVQFVYFQF